MCLIVFAYKTHSEYDLIFATNRDEAYRRPTRAARFWNKYPNVLAGKDLKAGGIWMGVNKTGNFAALTNFRDSSIKRENPPSRGQLALDYLTGDAEPKRYLQSVHKKADQFMSFNLLAGNADELFHYSNQEQIINRVEPGIHGLSNHLLDTPWPKVRRSKKRLKEIISGEFNEESLFELLKDDQPAADEELPKTGIGTKLERQVSPIFIKSENYGTRNSTILLINKKGNVTFEEQRFKKGTAEIDEVNRYEFKTEKQSRRLRR